MASEIENNFAAFRAPKLQTNTTTNKKMFTNDYVNTNKKHIGAEIVKSKHALIIQTLVISACFYIYLNK